MLHLNPTTLRTAATALKAFALEATRIEERGRIPNVLAALAVVLVRAQQERRPELVAQASITVQRLYEQRTATDPHGRLTTILGEASELMAKCASLVPSTPQR